MRMWMLSPKYLCRNHLLGEHKELHMLFGSLLKGRKISGYLRKGLLEPQNMNIRHNDLVIEMLRRGYQHKSPLLVDFKVPVGHVNRDISVSDLRERCTQCFKESV